jgi:methyl-accepting chemotaxis protein
VAAEVRKLADKSQQSAQEINNLTKSSFMIAQRAGNLFNKIVSQIQTTARLVQEITAASMEQTAGADQVKNTLQQLSNVIQHNAAASGEMAASAEELTSEADHLKLTIAYFKIDVVKHQLKANARSSNLQPVARRNKVPTIPPASLPMYE